MQLLLRRAGLPLDEWGRGPTKTVGQLLEEVLAGESLITIDRMGRPLRDVTVVGVDIAFTMGGHRQLRLVEVEQAFANGGRRTRALKTSLAEKRLPDEPPLDAARRAVEEELGLPAAELDFAATGVEVTVVESTSYPGLLSRHHLTCFRCSLPASLFKQSGYEERQPDKVTRFAWRAAA